MTLLGLVGTAAVSIDWFEGLETYRWDETPCTIVSSRVVAEGPDDGRHLLEVEYRYRYRGESYEGDAYRHDGSSFDEIADAQRAAARCEAGSERTCWVDPEEPTRAFLRRANLWRGLWVFAPLLFVAIGAGSLAFLFGPWRGLRAGGETGSGAVEKLLPFKALMLPVGLFGAFLLVGLGVLIPFFLGRRTPALGPPPHRARGHGGDHRSRADTPLALGSASFRVPADAPPTSTGDDTISWKLKLQGSIDYWPDVIEEYPIRVLPASDD